MFDIKVDNIPLINLRMEFNSHSELFSKPEFREQFLSRSYKPIEIPNQIWGGSPNTLLTILLQRAIAGIEAYIPGAVLIEAGRRGCLEEKDSRFLNNPYKLGGKGTVENYYHKLPSQLCKDFSLKNCNIKLWEENIEFYRTIRNPIFHGKEIDSKCVFGVLLSYVHLQSLYNWIDLWHDPGALVPGMGTLSSNPKWHR